MTGQAHARRLHQRTDRQIRAELGVKHARSRPRRPQAKRTVERFNRILLEEWALGPDLPVQHITRLSTTHDPHQQRPEASHLDRRGGQRRTR